MGKKTDKFLPGSYKDPSGSIFLHDNRLFRRVNRSYKKDYDLLNSSGLYDELTADKYLINHKELALRGNEEADVYKILEPEKVPFISYPYEWPFSLLKDAALLTLTVQKKALEKGISLKDASFFNIQLHRGKPIFIDTLSFEEYEKDTPWVAYGQFCQHFLAPLALMAYRDPGLNKILRVYLDGIPLEIASRLLPLGSYLNLRLLIHIHLHSRSRMHFADKKEDKSKTRLSQTSLLALIDDLENAIGSLKLGKNVTEWANYYDDFSYTPHSFRDKEDIFRRFVNLSKPGTAWDLGANTGYFSKITASMGIDTLSFDSDPLAVEKLYLDIKGNNIPNILPLCMDLTNPTPGLGWENREREPLFNRSKADLISALALVHHLCIGNNLPFDLVADFFRKYSRFLIIEFVPKEDPQTRRLLSRRKDVFPRYHEKEFEKIFGMRFNLIKKINIKDSLRSMYLYRNRKQL